MIVVVMMVVVVLLLMVVVMVVLLVGMVVVVVTEVLWVEVVVKVEMAHGSHEAIVFTRPHGECRTDLG